MLSEVGFAEVRVTQKPESRGYIKNWVPSSGAEEHVVSADIQAVKPTAGSASKAGCCAEREPNAEAAEPATDGCCAEPEPEAAVATVNASCDEPCDTAACSNGAEVAPQEK